MLLQSEAGGRVRFREWLPEDGGCSWVRRPDSPRHPHSVWHHAAGLWVPGPEQGRGEVSGQRQQEVLRGGACLWEASGSVALVGHDAYFLKVVLVVVIIWFPGRYFSRNDSLGRSLIWIFFLSFFAAGVCSLPDRRTNPFGETDDDSSTETDGNSFTPNT